MRTKSEPELFFLWHPRTTNIFSGYGLALAPAHLVGIVMIDRPTVADPLWLEELKKTFGAYQLAVMTQTGERGIICQMHIAQESLLHLKTVDHPFTPAIRSALLPLLAHPPAVTLALRWDQESNAWVSTILKGEGHAQGA
jgi:hypothetical protein